jgi:hypothetical protein
MTEPITILYRGGRLPSWDLLSIEQQTAFQNEHVEVLLRVAADHGLQRIEGFRLLAPLGDWQRWWTMRFADLAGAEAWMQAEVAPPYGRYGYYEYQLARQVSSAALDWLPQRTWPPPPATDPHVVPALQADQSSIIVLAFGDWMSDSDAIDPDQRGDGERRQRLQQVAADHGLLHGEVYQPCERGANGRVVWVLEFCKLAGAEAWIEAEVIPPASTWQRRSFHLARRWAPEYFATWPAWRSRQPGCSLT